MNAAVHSRQPCLGDHGAQFTPLLGGDRRHHRRRPRSGAHVPGRNRVADLKNQGRTPGNGPPATVAGVVLLTQNPAPTGMVPVNGVVKPSACARATISAPTARPITSPRANPGPAPRCAFTVS